MLWLDHRETVMPSAMHHQDGTTTPPAPAPKLDPNEKANKSQLFFGSVDGGGGVAARGIVRGVCYCCKTALAVGADAVLQRKLASLPNVKIITSALTTKVNGNGERVTGLSYKDRNSGTEHDVELEGIFVQIGLVPNTEWLKGTVELSKFGEIVVDAKGHTNVPGVFAAGDCTTVPYKQIVIAAGAGATAALSAFDHLIRN